MKGLGLGLGLSKSGTAAAQPVAWVNSTNTTVTDQGGGFYRITKTGGSNGASDAFAKTASAKTGDFTLYSRRAVELTNEIVLGLNDSPTNAFASMEHGVDYAVGGNPITSFDTGYTSVGNHGSTTTSDYWILQRVGSTISLYKNTAADVATAGAALRTWTDTTAFYGEVLILTVGESIDVKMV